MPRSGRGVPDGIGLVHRPPCKPKFHPAEPLWPPVDEPVVDEFVPTLDDLVNTIGARCCDLAARQTEISSRTTFAGWPQDHAPNSSCGGGMIPPDRDLLQCGSSLIYRPLNVSSPS